MKILRITVPSMLLLCAGITSLLIHSATSDPLPGTISPLEAVSSPETIHGSFQLEKEEYSVSEPILILFSVTNASPTPFAFDEGGDYRGTLRHHRYSFSVTNEAGRNFNQELWGDFGGLGRTVTLQPGQKYEAYLLLNAWTHLLPPGNYTATCERQLTLGARQKPPASTSPVPTIKQSLSFKIVDYNQQRVSASLREMIRSSFGNRPTEQVQRVWVGKPVESAFADVIGKLELNPSKTDTTDQQSKALSRLPSKWSDDYYLEYSLKSNRNWLTAAKPEPFILTFTVRNNGNARLAHRLEESQLLLDGVEVPGWRTMVEQMLANAAVKGDLEPGQVLSISQEFNTLLEDRKLLNTDQPNAAPHTFVWRIKHATKETQVDIRR